MKSRENTRVFVSYHHGLNKGHAEKIQSIIQSLGYNDISITDEIKIEDEDTKTEETIRREIRDRFLREVDVTIVIVGQDSINRKHIDWEIRSSIYRFENSREGSIVVVNALADENRGSKWIMDPELIDLVDVGKSPEKIRFWPNEFPGASNSFDWLPERIFNSIKNNYDYDSCMSGNYQHAVFPIIGYEDVKTNNGVLDRAIQHALEMRVKNKGKWDTNSKMMKQNRESEGRKQFKQLPE